MLRKPVIWYTVLFYVALSCYTNLQKYSADSCPQRQTSVSLFKSSYGQVTSSHTTMDKTTHVAW